MLIGARQVGKTTLTKKLKAAAERDGVRTLYLNLDITTDARFLDSQATLLQKIRLEFGAEYGIVFIDEIQRRKNAGRFLKGLYDQDLPIKFVVTGSGSLELKAAVAESLAGRKRVFPIHPLSFVEFFHYKTENKYRGREALYAEVESGPLDMLLFEYLSFGGYPRVVLAESLKEKRATIAEIFSAYVEKDIVGLLNVDLRESFILLLRLLAQRQGQPINYTGLANDTDLSRHTIKRYLYYGEETFVIQKLLPYFNNISKELTKSPEYYFLDAGLRNFAVGQFRLLQPSDEATGYAFEHFVYLQLRDLREQENFSLHYWRTADRQEIDFVINRFSSLLPIEVKSRAEQVQVPKTLLSFCQKYKCARGVVISRAAPRSVQADNVTIDFSPWWNLVFKNPV